MKRLAPIGMRTLAALAVLVGLDLGLRQLGNWGRWVVQERHGFYGWQMLPDQKRWSRYFDVRENTNALGYRDRDWRDVPAAVLRTYGEDFPPLSAVSGDARADDVLRIAVVGNSMTYGSSVPEEEVWTRVLERLLANELLARGDRRRVEVMNFAVQGYVFEQMARVFDTRIAPFLPDVLIVPTTTYDVGFMEEPVADFDYPLRRFVVRTAVHDYLSRRLIPRLRIPARTERDPDQPLSANEQQELLERWQALPSERRLDARRAMVEFIVMPLDQLPDELAIRWWNRRTPKMQVHIWHQATGRGRVALFDLLPGPEREQVRRDIAGNLVNIPYRPEMRYVWEHAAERLRDVRLRLEAHGGRLAVITLPSLQMVSRPGLPTPASFWGPWAADQRDAEGRTSVLEHDPVEALRAEMPDLARYLQEPSRMHVSERGSSFIPSHAPGFSASLFIPDDIGHYNARGHAVLAREIANFLLDSGVFAP